jgi:hypothetical protein
MIMAQKYASGPCVVCQEDSEGSPYWLGILPAPVMFGPGVNKPLCSAECSLEWNSKNGEYVDGA